jgi:hypothetical protein
MQVYVLTCEACGRHKSFLVYNHEIAGFPKKIPVQRLCSACGRLTNWRAEFSDRRRGRERRRASDRRALEQRVPIELPSLGKLQKLARHSASAYGFVHSLRGEHPQYQQLSVQELLRKIVDSYPKLKKQFPWLSYAISSRA